MNHQPPSHKPQPRPLALLNEPLRIRPRSLKVKPNHIRLRRRRKFPAIPFPHIRNLARPHMAGFEFAAEESVLDRDSRRRSNDSRLSQAATDHLADVPCAGAEGFVADEDAADRGAEALAEAERDAVEAGAVLLERAGAGGHGFPQARAVEVQDDLVLAGPGGDALALCEGRDDAAEGVFQADQAGGAGVDVVADDGVLLDVFEGEVVAVGGDDAVHERAAEGCHAAGFPLEDVAAVVGEDAVWRGQQVGADGDLVAHGAGADEQSGLVAG